VGHDYRTHVTALVVAHGRFGPVDAFTPVGGVPMVVRAVRTVLDGAGAAVDRCAVIVPPGRRPACVEACAGLPVDVHESFLVWTHSGQRAGGVGGDADSHPLLLVHDAARPLTLPALVSSVLGAALAHMTGPGIDAVVPVLPVTDTVKLVDADGLVTASPDRSGLRVLQTPLVLRRGLLGPDEDPLTAVARLAARGSVHTVPGEQLAFPVRTEWDLELAELLAGGVRA
jgi:2-C-methyl-D-erythritol 4-phosphate cytidylyltransferase